MAGTDALDVPLVRGAQIAFAALIVLRIGFDVAVPPIGDEAYYWMWGQKLGWSYLDHPPLHAWLLHLVGLVLGWNIFSLRALTWATLAGALWIIWLWSKRLNPQNPTAWFWPSAAIYLASPLFFLMSAISFHDHLLIFLCLLTAHLFLTFAAKWETSGRAFRWLYAAGAALGFTVLTKYNGVLLGIGVAAFFVVHKPLRPLWRSPHLYLAGLLAVAIQAPVLWWNAATGFASYNFHLSERWGGDFHFLPVGPLRFLVIAMLFISPFLVPALYRLARQSFTEPFPDRARLLALSVFTVSSLVMLALSFVVEVYFYWNIVAVLLLMPLLARTIRRWTLALHLAYGLLIALAVVFNYGIVPLGALLGQPDWYAASNFGWPETAARVAALRAKHPVGFIATTRYSTAAQLGFALRDPEVTALSDRHDQYDYWFDAGAHEGEEALVVSDHAIGLADISAHYETLTLLETVPYSRFGVTIYAPSIYLGTGFHAAPHQ